MKKYLVEIKEWTNEEGYSQSVIGKLEVYAEDEDSAEYLVRKMFFNSNCFFHAEEAVSQNGDDKPQNGDNVSIEELCGEEWTPHYGGPCPEGVCNKKVSVLFRDDTTNEPPNMEGHLWQWNHYNNEDDIIGYKII
jgi:hypothetical protein